MERNHTLIITCSSFKEGGEMPVKHTGFGADCSPSFRLQNLDDETVSLAVVLDDLDVPFTAAFTHWLLWNIPKTDEIPENIPYGAEVLSLGGAMQGVAYGKNRYRGPKQPFFIRKRHRYLFHFYALDCFLALPPTAGKKELCAAMNGHILQTGSYMGKFKRK